MVRAVAVSARTTPGDVEEQRLLDLLESFFVTVAIQQLRRITDFPLHELCLCGPADSDGIAKLSRYVSVWHRPELDPPRCGVVVVRSMPG